jgi:2-C-methyl-D-erythritol 4-phosphate cytidylyltransferase
MSNIALIIAGGSENRMGQDIPKQFVHFDGTLVIIHTMIPFEQHPDIDGIAPKPWVTLSSRL